MSEESHEKQLTGLLDIYSAEERTFSVNTAEQHVRYMLQIAHPFLEELRKTGAKFMLGGSATLVISGLITAKIDDLDIILLYVPKEAAELLAKFESARVRTSEYRQSNLGKLSKINYDDVKVQNMQFKIKLGEAKLNFFVKTKSLWVPGTLQYTYQHPVHLEDEEDKSTYTIHLGRAGDALLAKSTYWNTTGEKLVLRIKDVLHFREIRKLMEIKNRKGRTLRDINHSEPVDFN